MYKPLAISVLIVIGVALLCYGKLWFSLLLSPYVIFRLRADKAKAATERRWQLNLQFGAALRALSAAVESGYSVENAVFQAYRDLKTTYSEQDMIMTELTEIMMKLRNNIPIEDAFGAFGANSGIEDIEYFADVFSTAKRTGGNILSIIRSTSEMIRCRLEFKRDLKTAVAAKKYESDIMKVIPFAILAYLRVFSPEMTASLYGNIGGIAFMSVILIIYLILSRLADKIVQIEL